MATRETENNAYSNFWGDKQRALWYVMVFSGVVNRGQMPRGVGTPLRIDALLCKIVEVKSPVTVLNL